MNQLLIFYSGADSALDVVNHYRRQARGHASAIGKPIQIREIDVDSASEDERECWGGRETIECVTLRDDQVVDRVCNPDNDQLDAIIENL